MGWPDPALPAACSQVPAWLGRTHSSGNSTGQQVGGARQLHSDSTDGAWTWGLEGHRTALLGECAWFYIHYLEQGHLWKPQGLVVGPGWAAGSPVRLPRKAYIGGVSPYIFLKMTFSKNLKHLDC